MNLQIASSRGDKYAAGGKYALVREAITFLMAQRDGPFNCDALADHLSIDLPSLNALLADWSRLSPDAFAQALTTKHVRDLLAGSAAVFEPGQMDLRPAHAFNVTVTTITGDEARRRGAELEILHGFHESPFGGALVLMTEGSVCGVAFVDDDATQARREALDDMIGRWPRARYREAVDETRPVAELIFGLGGTAIGEAVPLVLIGTEFDVAVWEALLRIPMGQVVSYTDIARYLGRPTASRAVGTANGRNPISFVVPCHRALRSDGSLGGYYWGLTRKRAMIAWEIGRRC